ncbi:MAG: peptidoglycan recognition protein family protein [Chloroflexota bacterium]|nr:peptidoglycan recognition protein family protein [Chloroflexota bacterium]
MSNIALTPPTASVPTFVDYRLGIWGDSFTWALERRLSSVVKIVIHHTVTPRSASPDDIALLHKARGWGGIGYHIVITEDGTAWYCGDIGTARANVLNVNDMIIGIALPGDFTKEDPTDAQLKTCKGICEYLLFQRPDLPNIRSWDDVIGHKEAISLWPTAGATACPGNRWKEGLNMYHRMRYGPGWDEAVLPEPSGSLTPEQDFSHCFITVATRWPTLEEVDAWRKSGLAPYEWVQRFAPNVALDNARMQAFGACFITTATRWPTEDEVNAWIESGISAYEWVQRYAPNVVKDEKEEEIRNLHIALEKCEARTNADAQLGRKVRALLKEVN